MTCHRAVDIAGEVFGDLVAERRDHLSEDGRGWVWQCMCLGCGARLFRPVGQLRSAAKNGAGSACIVCRTEARNGRAWQRRARMAEVYAKAGTYWPGRSIDVLVDAVREALETEGHHPPAPDLNDTGESWEPGSYDGRRLPDLHIVDVGEDRTLECCECADWFSTGLGCVSCLEPVCTACGETHECDRDPPQHQVSLAAVGKTFGLSRERVRQIECCALRKLRELFTARSTSRTYELSLAGMMRLKGLRL